ncbi:MAG: hypothetical protein KDE47_11660 [Caldilineaceae bacterium]|nr:hypothetical protein [Caldilineaceae bacterium]
MTWLAHIGAHLPPLLYNSLLTLIIVVLTLGVAWGIRPAIQALLNRFGPRWRGLGATLVQLLLLVGGMALIVVAVGRSALLITIALGIAFFCGLMVGGVTVGGETMLADGIASIRIRVRKLYRVGDTVTLGDHHEHHHGVVQKIGRTKTWLVSPEQATVTVRNSFAVRRPIVVHQPSTATPVEDALPPQGNTPSIPDTAPHDTVQDAASPVNGSPVNGPPPTTAATTAVTQATVPASPIAGVSGSDAVAAAWADSPVNENTVADTDMAATDVAHVDVAHTDMADTGVNDMLSADQVGDDDALATDRSPAHEASAQPAESARGPRRLIQTPHANPLARRVVLGKRTVKDLR